MRIAIAGSILTLVIFVMQGIHVFKNGDMRPFLLDSDDLASRQPRLTHASRRLAVALFALMSMAIVYALTDTIRSHYDRSALVGWLEANVVNAIGGISFLVYGFVAVARPRIVINSALSAYDRYDIGPHYSSIKRIVRYLGVVAIGAGLLLLR